MASLADYEEEFRLLQKHAAEDLQRLLAALPTYKVAESKDLTALLSALGVENAVTAATETPAPGINRHEAVRGLQTNAARLSELAANMELEAHDVRPDRRAAAKKRVHETREIARRFEVGIAPLKAAAATADREELVARARRQGAKSDGNADPTVTPTSLDETDEARRLKADMVKGTETLRGGTSKLQQAERYAVEMNEAADATLHELHRQSDVIGRVEGTTQDIDQELSSVNRILHKMHKEMMKNKLMIGAIIALLAIMIVGIIYYKLGGIARTSNNAQVVSGAGGNRGAGGRLPGPGFTPGTKPRDFLPVLPLPQED